MIIELTKTNSAEIASALIKARRSVGSPAMGMVQTLVVVTDTRGFDRAYENARQAANEHPSRVLMVVLGSGKTSVLNAQVLIGEGTAGEVVVLRLSGGLAKHPQSVVLPLLLPDSPVVVWWPGRPPVSPGTDSLGRLANRRISDSSAAQRSVETIIDRARNHSRGDTDLAWTRLTPWRALLAAALDQYPATIQSATVAAARDNAPAQLMAAWLEAQLKVKVELTTSRGPGLTLIKLGTAAGDIAIERADGLMAAYTVPGQPRRLVALKRRGLPELITEELRRLDTDDIYNRACRVLVRRAEREAGESGDRTPSTKVPHTTKKAAAAKRVSRTKVAKKATPTKKAAPKKAAAKKAATKKTTAGKSTTKEAPARKTTRNTASGRAAR